MLFKKEINGWKSWGEVFQDKEAFTPLAHAILKEAGFPPVSLGALSPGTNAVFRAGDVVIKIYVPAESGLDTFLDWQNEQTVMKEAARLGVPSPKLLCAGEKQDKYLFRWIIMEYCPGKEAGDAFPEMTPAERAVFAGKVRDLLKKMNHPVDIIPRDLKKQAMENERLDRLHPALTAGLRERVMNMDLSGGVLVHGDCTGENLLVDEKGDPILIDFADCSIAPEWYELPAAVFELFRCDSTALEVLQGNESPDSFLEKLLDGLAVHDFGGDIIRTWFEREGILVDEISSVPQLKLLLGQKLRGEGCITGHFPHTVFPDLTGDPLTDARILLLANGKAATLAHAEQVAEAAAGLAEKFGADTEKCRTAALLHDIAAVLPREEMLQAAREMGMELDPAEEEFPMLLHQRFGAILARDLFGVTDLPVLSAVRCHTTLKRDPSDIDMILFLADKIRWDRGGEPPFLGAIENGLRRSLKAACLEYLDYITHHGMILRAHRLLAEAHMQLRRDRAKGML